MKSRGLISITGVILFLVGLGAALALGYYHRAVRAAEGYHQFYSFPADRARPVALHYGEGGLLHRLVSPHALGGTLGLTNTHKPVKVKLELVGVPAGLEVHWGNSHTKNFNLENKTIERVLNPGDSFSVHHTFYIEKALRDRSVIYDGGLRVVDTESEETLIFVPIQIRKGESRESRRAGAES
jgi:hypothetical protein